MQAAVILVRVVLVATKTWTAAVMKAVMTAAAAAVIVRMMTILLLLPLQLAGNHFLLPQQQWQGAQVVCGHSSNP
jgi:hypothetical protein